MDPQQYGNTVRYLHPHGVTYALPQQQPQQQPQHPQQAPNQIQGIVGQQHIVQVHMQPMQQQPQQQLQLPTHLQQLRAETKRRLAELYRSPAQSSQVSALLQRYSNADQLEEHVYQRCQQAGANFEAQYRNIVAKLESALLGSRSAGQPDSVQPATTQPQQQQQVMPVRTQLPMATQDPLQSLSNMVGGGGSSGVVVGGGRMQVPQVQPPPPLPQPPQQQQQSLPLTERQQQQIQRLNLLNQQHNENLRRRLEQNHGHSNHQEKLRQILDMLESPEAYVRRWDPIKVDNTITQLENLLRLQQTRQHQHQIMRDEAKRSLAQLYRASTARSLTARALLIRYPTADVLEHHVFQRCYQAARGVNFDGQYRLIIAKLFTLFRDPQRA